MNKSLYLLHVQCPIPNSQFPIPNSQFPIPLSPGNSKSPEQLSIIFPTQPSRLSI
ncbi:MAG: hypothetical protein V7K98_02240 [Nostoc sp.]|uniref:hypothetical protein n=1 Tax=Nostoc sp. TaxID=1180 RepID=UPI002FFC9DE5